MTPIQFSPTHFHIQAIRASGKTKAGRARIQFVPEYFVKWGKEVGVSLTDASSTELVTAFWQSNFAHGVVNQSVLPQAQAFAQAINELDFQAITPEAVSNHVFIEYLHMVQAVYRYIVQVAGTLIANNPEHEGDIQADMAQLIDTMQDIIRSVSSHFGLNLDTEEAVLEDMQDMQREHDSFQENEMHADIPDLTDMDFTAQFRDLGFSEAKQESDTNNIYMQKVLETVNEETYEAVMHYKDFIVSSKGLLKNISMPMLIKRTREELGREEELQYQYTLLKWLDYKFELYLKKNRLEKEFEGQTLDMDYNVEQVEIFKGFLLDKKENHLVQDFLRLIGENSACHNFMATFLFKVDQEVNTGSTLEDSDFIVWVIDIEKNGLRPGGDATYGDFTIGYSPLHEALLEGMNSYLELNADAFSSVILRGFDTSRSIEKEVKEGNRSERRKNRKNGKSVRETFMLPYKQVYNFLVEGQTLQGFNAEDTEFHQTHEAGSLKSLGAEENTEYMDSLALIGLYEAQKALKEAQNKN